MRLYYLTERSGAELIRAQRSWDTTSTVYMPWLGRTRVGVQLTDRANSRDDSWLVVVELDEPDIVAFEIPRTSAVRRMLASVTRGRRAREWLVPHDGLNTRGRITDVGSLANPMFAAR